MSFVVASAPAFARPNSYGEAAAKNRSVTLIRSRINLDRIKHGGAHRSLSVACLDRYHEAIDLYNRDLMLARELKDQQRESCALGNIGRAYDGLSEFKQAMEYHVEDLVSVGCVPACPPSSIGWLPVRSECIVRPDARVDRGWLCCRCCS